MKEYLNLGVHGQTNVMDVMISILWMILGAVRVFFIAEKWEFDGQNAHWLQQAYLLGFGLQIILLTMRGLSLFSNSKYLGSLLRIIKLMVIEIIKFLGIFLVVMVGFLFGLWMISAANVCHAPDQDADPEAYQAWMDEHGDDCGDYEVADIWDGLIYVFQVSLFYCLPSK